MIIAISGKIGSGKDTLGAYMKVALINEGYYPSIKKFAHNLKAITAIVSGLTIEDMYSDEGKKKMVPVFGKTVGELQQIIGTELFRDNFDKQVWIKSLLAPYVPEKDIWIVTDMRFKNELEAVRNSGPNFTIRIEGDPAGINANSDRDKTHISECDLDDVEEFDYRYRNESGIIFLEEYSKQLAKVIIHRLQGSQV